MCPDIVSRDYVGVAPPEPDDDAGGNPYLTDAVAPDADWLDGFPELKSLRATLRQQRARGELDLENINDLNVLQSWSNALAGLEREALETFVEETFVALGLATGDEARYLVNGLRLFRRREWNALSPHVRAKLVQQEKLTASLVDGFRQRLQRALAIMGADRERPLSAEFLETGNGRNDLIEIKGAIEFMRDVAEGDPFLRLRLQQAIRETVKDPAVLRQAIGEYTVPMPRLGGLIRQAVKKILDTVIHLETSNVKAQHPKLYAYRARRASAALAGHLRRARELGCSLPVRTCILDELKPHPAIFERYFGARHPLL